MLNFFSLKSHCYKNKLNSFFVPFRIQYMVRRISKKRKYANICKLRLYKINSSENFAI